MAWQCQTLCYNFYETYVITYMKCETHAHPTPHYIGGTPCIEITKKTLKKHLVKHNCKHDLEIVSSQFHNIKSWLKLKT